MTLNDFLDLIGKFVAISVPITGIFLYIGNLKSTIDRNQRRVKETEEKLDKYELELREVKNTLIFLGNSANMASIRLNHVETHLSKTNDFDPVSLRVEQSNYDRRTYFLPDQG